LYVASKIGDAVLRYDGSTGAFLDTFVPQGTGGLDKPTDVLFGPDANGDGSLDLYVSGDLSENILRFDGVTGDLIDEFIAPGMGGSNGFAFGPDGNLYVGIGAELDNILKYDGSTGAFIEVFVASGSAGLDGPRQISFHSDGLLYVASGESDAILRYDASTGDFVDEYIGVTMAGLDKPVGFVFDNQDSLIVTSQNTNEIHRYAPASSAAFTVSLSRASPVPVSVDFQTNDGTAENSADYNHVTGTLTFEPGVTERTIVVATLDDAVAEATETFQTILTNPAGGILSDATGVASIFDDDPAPPNQPPEAEAGGPYVSSEDSAVTFDAAASSDADNDPLGYTWDFGDGNVTTTSSSTIDHIYLWGETFIVTLTVDDGRGGTDTTTTTATISEVNDPPMANAGGFYSGVESIPVVFDGSGSSDFDNEDGSVANNQPISYTWDFGDGQVGSGVTPSHTYASAGTYTVSLSVSDGVQSDVSTTTAEVTTAPTGDPNTLYVYDIRFESKRRGKDWRAVFEIRSDSDADGQGTSSDSAAANVSVEVVFAGVTYTGTTDSNGIFRSGWIRNLSSGDHYANAVDLVLAGFAWNPLDLDLENDSDGDGKPDDVLTI
jgi:PKD repeat protein